MKKIHIPGQHSLEDFKNGLSNFEQDDDITSVLIMTAANTKIDVETYGQVLKETNLDIVGGIFPEVLFNGKNYDEGTIMLGIRQSMQSIPITDMSNSSVVREQLVESFGNINPKDKTIFMFIDALLEDKEVIFDALYNEYGTLPKYIGGGAGSLKFESFPCLYSNEGIFSSGVILGVCPFKTEIGVAHGWKEICSPMKVTEVEKNRIKSLDWKPAMEIYQEIVEEHSKASFNHSDFFNSSKSYPFGISKLNAEKVVRDPFKQEEGTIYTLDSIDLGSYVTVLYGSKDSLLEGAQTAFNNAHKTEEFNEDKQLIIIDCISRVLFLGDHFDEEIVHLDPKSNGFGALTLGEIANNGDSYLEVFNKTAVVCALNE